MEDLFKSYFEAINNQNLFGSKDIIFLLDAKIIPQNSKELIDDYIKDDESTILVVDQEEKIKINN